MWSKKKGNEDEKKISNETLPAPLSYDSEDDDEKKTMEVPPPHPPQISLQDVKQAYPPESQEESMVMDHIERTDPTKEVSPIPFETTPDGQRLYIAPSTNTTATSTLDHSSATGLPSIYVEQLLKEKLQKKREEKRREEMMKANRRLHGDSNSHISASSSRRSSRSTERSRQKPTSKEDTLFNLTTVLRARQSVAAMKKNKNTNPLSMDAIQEEEQKHLENEEEYNDVEEEEEEEEEERRPFTQAEMFRNHASTMMSKVSNTVDGNAKRASSFFTGSKKKQNNGNNDGGGNSNHSKPSSLKEQASHVKENFREIKKIIQREQTTIWHYVRRISLYILLPCLVVSVLLFYAFGNPGAGVIYVEVEEIEDTNATGANGTTIGGNETSLVRDQRVVSNEQPSYSWLFLFFGVRQVLTFAMAVGLQSLIVTVYQQAGLHFGCAGPMFRLFVIQAKGWPLVLVFWGILDLIFLFGANRFANHWLYYQNAIKVFNDSNPSGNFPDYDVYRQVVIFCVCAGLAVAIKRFFIGLRFGQNSYYRYSDRLTQLLKQILEVSRIARLTEIKDEHIRKRQKSILDDAVEVNVWLENHAYASHPEKNEDGDDVLAPANSSERPDGEESDTLLTSLSLGLFDDGSISNAQQIKIDELLGEWEEVDIDEDPVEEPSLSAIVQFGSSLGVLESVYPFGQAFGFAETRHDVVDCSQHVYSDLLKLQQKLSLGNAFDNSEGNNPNVTLKFHTIALIAVDAYGTLDTKMAKDLMAIFRPTREGDITLIDFAKSIDLIYKEMRKLRASIANEARMNSGAEKLINVLFYFVLICLFLAALGIDPLVVFGGLAAFIISFSFCVSGASSDYVRGLLFILVQRPYDIGDRIAIASADAAASGNGSPQWLVKDVSLYHTSLVYEFSQEHGTVSNGSISNMRILNAARSPRANAHFFLKFGIRVKLEQIEEFKERLFDFVRSKPREWLKPACFRLNTIAADLGYTEYFVLFNHRESWQNIGAIKNSLSDVQKFCYDLTAELDMGYESPALPVRMEGSFSSNILSNFAEAANNNSDSPGNTNTAT